MNETTSKPLAVYEFEGVEFLRTAALELKLLKVYQDSKLHVEKVPKRFKINNIVFFLIHAYKKPLRNLYSNTLFNIERDLN